MKKAKITFTKKYSLGVDPFAGGPEIFISGWLIAGHPGCFDSKASAIAFRDGYWEKHCGYD